MLTISKSKLKAHMLEIFRQIETSGEEIIITHHNKPVLRITPIKASQSVASAFSDLQGQVVYHADPNEPTSDEWRDV